MKKQPFYQLVHFFSLPALLIIMNFVNVPAQNQGQYFECGTGEAFEKVLKKTTGTTDYAPYGGVLTPKGDVKVLVIYAGFEDSFGGNQFLYGWSNTGNNDLPTYVNAPNGIEKNLMYINNSDFSTYANDANVRNISKYYYEMSAGTFRMTCDVLRNPSTKKAVRININPSGAWSWYDCNQRVYEKIKALFPSYNLSPFDNRTNNPYYQYDNSTSAPDFSPDYVVIYWRYSQSWNQQPVSGMNKWSGSGGGFASAASGWVTIGNYTFDGTGFTICTGSGVPFDLFTHEFAHTLYSCPHYGSANGVVGNHFYNNIAWGMMSSGINVTQCANGWERWFLGWINIKHDLDNSSDNGIYTLRDFVTTSDVIRIKLPFVTEQYLWIENHQNKSIFDTQKLKIDGAGNLIPSAPKGVLAYIENISDSKSNLNIFNSGANGIKVLSGQGNYDYTNPNNYVKAPEWWDNIVYDYAQGKPNSLGSHNSVTNIRNDYYGMDNKIDYDPYTNGPEKVKNNESFPIIKQNGNFTYSTLGSDIAFGVGKKAGLSENPTIINHQTYNANTKQLSPIYLNGISIKVLRYNTNGDAEIEVKFDDINIDKSTRWTGNIMLGDINMSGLGYDINILSNNIVTIDKSGTPNRETRTLNSDFINPTEFTCLQNAYFHMEPNSQLIVDNGSELLLKQGSRLEVHEGATVTVRNGSKLTIEDGAEIVIHRGGKIVIEPGAEMDYQNKTSNKGITFNSTPTTEPEPSVEFQGNLHIGDNADFTFTGNGYVKFNMTTPVPFALTRNITAGTGARMTFKGADINDKVLEVTQEGMYPPDNISFFMVIDGTVALGEGSRVTPTGGSTAISLRNARITSTSGTNNAHRGLTIFGQRNVTIDGCVFENGIYGIYAFLTYGGNPLRIELYSLNLNYLSITYFDI